MATNLSLSSKVEVFPCPNCRQTINTSMHTCPFCSAAIDRTAADASAEVLAQVNQACSDASYLKIMAGSALTFFLVQFIPFLGLVGALGFRFVEVALPFMSIRWWIRFGSLKTDDPDSARARRIAKWTAVGSILFLTLVIILSIIFRRLIP